MICDREINKQTVSESEAIMPLMVGGGHVRADRSVIRVLFPLAAVLLLLVRVSAVPEELKPAQEQPPQEVKPLITL